MIQKDWLEMTELPEASGLFLEILLEFLKFGTDDKITIAGSWILFKIVLMIILSRVENIDFFYFCHNGACEKTGCFFHGGLGHCFLPFVMPHDGGSVLRSNISALPVQARRIVGSPEKFQHPFVSNFYRIKYHLHDLRMTRCPFADMPVGWILDMATRVA